MDSGTCSPLRKVALCDICGVEGFREFLAVCTECNKSAEHIYCVQTVFDSLPASWVCESCKLTQNCTHDVQPGTFVHVMDCSQAVQIVHDSKSLDEQRMSGLEHEELKRSLLVKGRLENDSSSLTNVPEQGDVEQVFLKNRPIDSTSSLSGTMEQVGALKDIYDDKSKFGLVGRKSILGEELSDSEKLAHSRKFASGSKQSASSASQSKENEHLFSFLLPNKCKPLSRSKSLHNPVPHSGAQKKAEQLTIQPTCFEPTSSPQLRKAVQVRVQAPMPGAFMGNERLPLQGFEGMHHRNCSHQGMLSNCSAADYCGPGHFGPSYPISGDDERQQAQHSFDSCQEKLLERHELVMQHSIVQQMSNQICFQNSTPFDSISPRVRANPYAEKFWRGVFNVEKGDNVSKIYEGIQGHPSSLADQRVWKAARSLPRLLKVKELPRRLDDLTWPKPFSLDPPNSQSVGIFFFPTDMDSHNSWYKPLVDRLIAHDLMLRAESTFLYLLIFHSQLFPEAERCWDGRYYLWGMFLPKKCAATQNATIVQSVQDGGDNAEIIDMEIDTDDIQPCLELCKKIPLPPLPPGLPPVQPPPPSP